MVLTSKRFNLPSLILLFPYDGIHWGNEVDDDDKEDDNDSTRLVPTPAPTLERVAGDETWDEHKQSHQWYYFSYHHHVFLV